MIFINIHAGRRMHKVTVTYYGTKFHHHYYHYYFLKARHAAKEMLFFKSMILNNPNICPFKRF